MNTKEQAEREYRAQWIRDAARDMVCARENGCALPLDPPGYSKELLADQAFYLASRLWDRYVEERDK